MWEQIAVRIILTLVFQRLKEKHLIEEGTSLEDVVKTKSMLSISELENILIHDFTIQDEVVEMGIELTRTVLKIGNFLKGLGK